MANQDWTLWKRRPFDIYISMIHVSVSVSLDVTI